MGNAIKLVSGFILFVIGVLISYETYTYNLVDILLIVGLLIIVIGMVLIASYIVESNVDKTANKIKEFLDSKEVNSGFNRQNTSQGPLRVRREYDDYDEIGYDDLIVEEFSDSTPGEYYGNSDDSKLVLRGVPREEKEVDLDKPLVFTPQYGRPLKVTRVPKKRQADYFEQGSESVEPIVIETDKSEEIKRALEEPTEDDLPSPKYVASEVTEPRDIKIDINDPEKLPVPKSLNSHIISDEEVLTSQEAFDKLAVHINKEVMLEIPSLNNLSDRFLSHVPSSYSRIIIDEFDPSDMSYMFLISSLLKQGVHIKTVPKVHTVNLIADDSYAMIISAGNNDFEYGAIYDDRDSISTIRSSFEKTWSIASNLDESILVQYAGGSA